MLPITPSGKSLSYILQKALIFINNKIYLIKKLIFEATNLIILKMLYLSINIKGDFMEEQSQKECKTKNCCVKGIVIVIVCSLICFFLGYYAGSKSLMKVSNSAINRPFNPNFPPRIPKQPNVPKLPKVPNIKKPPIPPAAVQNRVQQPNIPNKVQQAKVETPKKVEAPK